jgi:hypothetical protein
MSAHWQSVPIVLLPKARCAHCNTTRPPILVSSRKCGDGAVVRQAVCRACSMHYLITIDPTIPCEIIQPLEKPVRSRRKMTT